jgi:hypothetical protein
MIHYLVTERHTEPMRLFLQSWGASLAARLRIITYEALLAGAERLPERGGSYIFTNLGSISRMSPQARSAICDLHDRLVRTHGADKVLNDPARSLRRYDLLRHLHERGINAFNAYPATEPAVRARLPAFLRYESLSIFDQPVLARDPEQYEAQLRGIKWRCGSLAGFIAIEFCDTVDSTGLYRKYGAFVVGDRIVPRHIFFSRNWHIKFADLAEPTMIEEELAYLHGNPHADALLECARLAGISYGRIDYGLLDRRPQIWEINTNAGLASSPQASAPARRPALLRFVTMFADALEDVDSKT